MILKYIASSFWQFLDLEVKTKTHFLAIVKFSSLKLSEIW